MKAYAALVAKPKRRPRRKHRQFLRLAVEMYPELVARFGEQCRLCGSKPKTRRLHIDHDHYTMKVRGLLCFRCNHLLRSWVTPAWLKKAAWYLENA